MLQCSTQFGNGMNFVFLSPSHYHVAYKYVTAGYIKLYEHPENRFKGEIYQETNTTRNI